MTPADLNRYIVLQQFGNLQQAIVAKSVLDASGIESFVADENAARITLSNLGGIRLFVKQSDAEAAAVALRSSGPQQP